MIEEGKVRKGGRGSAPKGGRPAPPPGEKRGVRPAQPTKPPDVPAPPPPPGRTVTIGEYDPHVDFDLARRIVAKIESLNDLIGEAATAGLEVSLEVRDRSSPGRRVHWPILDGRVSRPFAET